MFLNAESINSGRINKDAANFITENKYSEIKKGRVKYGDILLTTRGNGIGDSAYVDITESALINAQMLILRSSMSEFDSRFLFYYMRSSAIKSLISIFSSGSAQPQIPIRDLKFIPTIIPPLPIQKNIAAILESLAEEIYREWFVRMRFPGHDKAKMIKGVPEGWEVIAIDKL